MTVTTSNMSAHSISCQASVRKMKSKPCQKTVMGIATFSSIPRLAAKSATCPRFLKACSDLRASRWCARIQSRTRVLNSATIHLVSHRSSTRIRQISMGKSIKLSSRATKRIWARQVTAVLVMRRCRPKLIWVRATRIIKRAIIWLRPNVKN